MGKLASVIEMARWCAFSGSSYSVSIPQCKLASLHGLNCSQQRGPINKGTVKSIIVFSPNEVLDSNENEHCTTMSNNLEESRDHKFDRKNPETKERTQYDSV